MFLPELSAGTALLRFAVRRAGLGGKARTVLREPVLGLLTGRCPALSVLFRFLVVGCSWAGIEFGAPRTGRPGNGLGVPQDWHSSGGH